MTAPSSTASRAATKPCSDSMTAFVNGPNVKAAAVQPARLAETGQKQPWLPVVGGGLLLGSLALMRSRRRLLEARTKA